jgi:cytosine/uracil/thiamine/allantoin permease
MVFAPATKICRALALMHSHRGVEHRILPWNLYNSPLVIVYFLSGLGALLGPLYGVIMVDYWLVRKGQVNVPQLYSEDPTAPITTAAGSTCAPWRRSFPPPGLPECST